MDLALDGIGLLAPDRCEAAFDELADFGFAGASGGQEADQLLRRHANPEEAWRKAEQFDEAGIPGRQAKRGIDYVDAVIDIFHRRKEQLAAEPHGAGRAVQYAQEILSCFAPCRPKTA